jgi:hypothetical protein
VGGKVEAHQLETGDMFHQDRFGEEVDW